MALLERHANVNVGESGECGESGTPLHVASEYGFLDVAHVLLEQRANVNATGRPSGWTPLHLAVWVRNIEMAKYLLERRAQVNAACVQGQRPLWIAVQSDDMGAVE